jgi:hypothetical protein
MTVFLLDCCFKGFYKSRKNGVVTPRGVTHMCEYHDDSQPYAKMIKNDPSFSDKKASHYSIINHGLLTLANFVTKACLYFLKFAPKDGYFEPGVTHFKKKEKKSAPYYVNPNPHCFITITKATACG